MPPAVTVKVLGVEELHFKLTEGVPKPIKRMMFHIRGAALKAAKEGAKPHPVDKGTIALTIKGFANTARIENLSARIWTNAPIAVDVERGRKPGNPPSLAATKRWAKRHGISTHPAVLRKRMKQRGTEGIHFMEKAGDKTRGRLSEFIAEAEAAIKADWNK